MEGGGERREEETGIRKKRKCVFFPYAIIRKRIATRVRTNIYMYLYMHS